MKGLPLGFYRAIACPTVVASTQQHLIGVNAPFASTAMLLSEQRQRTSQQGLPPAVRDWPGDCRRLRDRAAGEVGKPRLLYRRLASALPTPESTGPDPPTRIVRVRPGNRRRRPPGGRRDCLLASRVSALWTSISPRQRHPGTGCRADPARRRAPSPSGARRSRHSAWRLQCSSRD